MRMIVREVKCFLCGFTLGEVVSNGAHRIFRRHVGCGPLRDGRLSLLRCPRCAGPVFLDGAETTSRWYGETPQPRPAVAHSAPS